MDNSYCGFAVQCDEYGISALDISSIGHGVAGLIWIVHPVKMNDIRPEKQQIVECRIAGAILILLGIMLRAKLY